MKNLLKIAAILIVAILVYNYFLGTSEERTQSEQIFNEIKDVGVSIKDLLVDEKEKFEQGKYDDLLDQMEGLFKRLRDNAGTLSDSAKNELEGLEKELSDIQADSGTSEEQQQAIKDRIEQLLKETEEFVKENEQ